MVRVAEGAKGKICDRVVAVERSLGYSEEHAHIASDCFVRKDLVQSTDLSVSIFDETATRQRNSVLCCAEISSVMMSSHVHDLRICE